MGKAFLCLGSLAIILGGLFLSACTTSGTSSPTAASSSSAASEPDVPLKVKTVWAGSYKDDIQPIFDRYCVECHGPKRAENDLRLDSFEGARKGTKFGEVITPGSSSSSALVFVIDGTASKQIQMPHEGRKLSHNRIENIKAWIDAGANQ